MTSTAMSRRTTVGDEGTDQRRGDPNTMKGDTTVGQRVAICFVAGVVGALAVVLSSHVLFQLGLVVDGPIPLPVAFEAPGIYRPLFWGGLWGIPFGLLIKSVWSRRYLFGIAYFIAPILATFLFFLPMNGAGYFGLEQAGPMFPLTIVLVNVPFGIVTALVASAIIGKNP